MNQLLVTDSQGTSSFIETKGIINVSVAAVMCHILFCVLDNFASFFFI